MGSAASKQLAGDNDGNVYHALKSGVEFRVNPVLPSAPTEPNVSLQTMSPMANPFSTQSYQLPASEDEMLAEWHISSDSGNKNKLQHHPTSVITALNFSTIASLALERKWWRILTRFLSENLLPDNFITANRIESRAFVGCLEFARFLVIHASRNAVFGQESIEKNCEMRFCIDACLGQDAEQVETFLMSLLQVPGQIELMPWSTVTRLVAMGQSRVLDFYVKNLTGDHSTGPVASKMLETPFENKHSLAWLLERVQDPQTVSLAQSLAFLAKRGRDTLSKGFGQAELEQLEKEAQQDSEEYRQSIYARTTRILAVVGVDSQNFFISFPRLFELVCAEDCLDDTQQMQIDFLLRGDSNGSSWKLVQKVVHSWHETSGKSGVMVIMSGEIDADEAPTNICTWRYLVLCILKHHETYPNAYLFADAIADLELFVKLILVASPENFAHMVMFDFKSRLWTAWIIMFLAKTADVALVAAVLNVSSRNVLYHVFVTFDSELARRCFDLLVMCRRQGHLLGEASTHVFADTLQLACVRGDLDMLKLFADNVGVGEQHWIGMYKNHASCPTQKWMRQTLSLGSDASFRESLRHDLESARLQA